MEDLKIYTIDELFEKSKGPWKRGKKGAWKTPTEEDKEKGKKLFQRGKFDKPQSEGDKWRSQERGHWNVSAGGGKDKGGGGSSRPPEDKNKTSWAAKSLGDCYTIDELYELEKGKVYDPGAVAAAIGRKKYGAKKFAEMSAAGKKRGKKAKGKARMAPGGGGRFAKLESEIAAKNKGGK